MATGAGEKRARGGPSLSPHPRIAAARRVPDRYLPLSDGDGSGGATGSDGGSSPPSCRRFVAVRPPPGDGLPSSAGLARLAADSHSRRLCQFPDLSAVVPLEDVARGDQTTLVAALWGGGGTRGLAEPTRFADGGCRSDGSASIPALLSGHPHGPCGALIGIDLARRPRVRLRCAGLWSASWLTTGTVVTQRDTPARRRDVWIHLMSRPWGGQTGPVRGRRRAPNRCRTMAPGPRAVCVMLEGLAFVVPAGDRRCAARRPSAERSGRRGWSGSGHR